MIGLGTQDDFPFARRFRADGGLEHVPMLWDPSFATWQTIGVQTNSQMMLFTGEMEPATGLLFGFDSTAQADILSLAEGL